jgi:hypothetical protein
VLVNFPDTYVCLFTLAVRGSLGAVIGAAEDTITFLNATLSSIEANIVSEAASAQSAILSDVNGLISGVSSVLGLGTITIPPINLPSTVDLLHITIPDTVTTALETLNKSIPTFEQVKNATDTAISFPFELLKVRPSISSELIQIGRSEIRSWQLHF